MSVKIRLKRLGKTRAPFYRVVVADERSKRNGRVIEEIGTYDPTREPSIIEIESERAQYWLSVGAQPTEAVTALLKLTGDWGKFKGEGPTESQVKPQPEKEVFQADSNKKPVLKPKAEKKAEETEAPAEEAATEEAAPAAEETQE
ncbi:30S ribosomal protein S16 [Gulosibacter bifidus]|uniref:Small ribosomal subunit protein bS16 n=1 Tax=Gulosibacter bifidus TaxID=272239 RepID=A0ABW5RII1_9MICO|nr:30S ribosomal protein S16 [Gulosibacter bifidus]